jgi:hypothetical protein
MKPPSSVRATLRAIRRSGCSAVYDPAYAEFRITPPGQDGRVQARYTGDFIEAVAIARKLGKQYPR